VRRHISFQLVRDVLLCVASAVVIIWSASLAARAPAAAPPRINGAYELAGSGPNTVNGQAVVSAQRVRITGTVTDGSGSGIPFSAPDLAIDRSTYRFTGTGTLGSTTATVSGRLDPDDQTVKKCRIVGTFACSDGQAGRFAGAHR
jgi:hypothetical protein